jgi:hypothetical protein
MSAKPKDATQLWSIYSTWCHETGSLGLESKVEWLYSEDSKLRREAREYRSFGVLNTSQPYASSRSRDAKFTSEAAERNTWGLSSLKEYCY